MSLATLKKKTAHKYNNNSVNQPQFALNGTHRNQGFVGQTSLSRTNTIGGSLENSLVVKASVLSSNGMMAKRTQWVRRPFPYSSTKPGDTLNQSSASAYIVFKQKKTLKEESDACASTNPVKVDACGVPLVKLADKLGVATTQGEYMLKLIGECANLDISYIEYSQNATKRPVNVC